MCIVALSIIRCQDKKKGVHFCTPSIEGEIPSIHLPLDIMESVTALTATKLLQPIGIQGELLVTLWTYLRRLGTDLRLVTVLFSAPL